MTASADQDLPSGTPVDVFSRFSVAWISGFEVANMLRDGYRLLRLSDRSVLPATFSIDDVRRHHDGR